MNSRTKRQNTGLGGGGSLLTPTAKCLCTQPSMLKCRKIVIIPLSEEQVAPLPGRLPSLCAAGNRGGAFSSFVLPQRRPSPHCWVTQSGGLLWLSCSLSIELFLKGNQSRSNPQRQKMPMPQHSSKDNRKLCSFWLTLLMKTFYLFPAQIWRFFLSFFFFLFPNMDIDYEDIILNRQHGSSSLGNKPAQLENKDTVWGS